MVFGVKVFPDFFFFLQSLKILWDDLHEQKALSLVPVRDVGIILVLVEGEALV